MKYYIYKPNELFLCSVIATDKSQIKSTLEHYIERGDKFSIPADNQIYETEKFSMNFTLPLSSPRFNFKTEIMPGITLNTNTNSVWWIQTLAKDYKSLKCGSLYEFTSTILQDGIYFLPEEVMIGLKNYDWTKHWDMLNEWERIIKGLENSNLDRVKTYFDKETKKKGN